MKSLLDILQKEQELTNSINKITGWIDSDSAQIKRITSSELSEEERKVRIKFYSDEREYLYKQRAIEIQDLEEIRNELLVYVRRIFDK